MTIKRLWIAFVVFVGAAFFLLGFFGQEVYRQAPPIPERVATADGRTVYSKDQILTGQQVWQSLGGQQIGSIWGHGAYQAPDWSADWLYRESRAMLASWSRSRHGQALETLDAEQRGGLEAKVREELRRNTFADGVVTISADREAAIQATAAHYKALFGGAPELAELRESYALHDQALTDTDRQEALCAFFFWTAWSCITERPGHDYTYTNNWPHDPLLGNQPTAANLLWSVASVILLLAAIALLVWVHEARKADDPEHEVPAEDPLKDIVITPSMRALGKYLAVVVALFGVQVLLGALTAHYTVEGDSFFGLPIHEYIPYAVSRTWHIQTALFWIATAFLSMGLFMAPLVSGRDPAYQRLGVNVLFGALLVVVAGSLAGEWLSIKQQLGLEMSFWFGHQGYEYVDLGRAWQIGLFIGLLLWLTLMLRALAPALRGESKGGESNRSLLGLFTISVIAIGLLYGSGFMFSARTHLSVAEYWRWWVVHLWVEGFFEVFATGTMAYLFSRLGLVSVPSATRAFLASTTIFLIGGIPGTFHHLYFSGTPISITAIGAMFSALEVVPLVLIGKEAVETLHMGRRAPWMSRYKWPLTFFVGVCFWNLVGAGLFGFLINPPIALYFMQGLNTTPVHGHTALFGVYGLLSLGLVLLIARQLGAARPWRDRVLRYSFWSMNIGLSLMVLLSLLPIGLAQTYASIDTGLWYARSADFLQLPALETLRWLRIIGDTIFLTGVAAFAWFMLGLKTGWSYEPESPESEQAGPAPETAEAETERAKAGAAA